MTSTRKYTVAAGICLSSAFVFAMAIYSGTDGGDGQKSAMQNPPVQKAEAPLQVAGATQVVQSQPVPAKSTTPSAVVQINPLPANATSVPDADLQQLATLVNLAAARNQQPDKAQWTQVIPVARKLMEGPCDCAQKVWLKHFIEMGNYAVAGSNDQYYETASLMATLGRNDDQAMALSHK